MPGKTGVLHALLAIIGKDLMLELRGRESLALMLFLSLLLLVVFSFALEVNGDNTARLAPGILWVVFTFSGILGMGRTTTAEQDDGAYLAIALSPVGAEIFLLGKVLSNTLFLLAMELCTILAFAVLFDYEELLVLLPQLLMPLGLTTLGFGVVGTLVSFLSAASRYGEILLPFLFLPLVIPLLLGGVSATGAILAGEPGAEWNHWLKIVAAFDIIYSAMALLLFHHLLEE